MSIPIVQEYDVKSEGPILPWLRLMVEDRKVSHFNQETKDGIVTLVLFWSAPPASQNSIPLLGTKKDDRLCWIGPNIAQLASMIEAWLETCEYPPKPYTDGFVKKGWRINNSGCFGYKQFIVQPYWQVYGK